MTNEQLEQAKQRVTKLLKYQKDTEELREFIWQAEENKSLNLLTFTSHQKELYWGGKEIYAMIGDEVIELLKKRLQEREEFIDKLGAEDLVKEGPNGETNG